MLPVRVCVQIPFFRKDTSHWGKAACRLLCDLVLTNHLCIDLFPNKVCSEVLGLGPG